MDDLLGYKVIEIEGEELPSEPIKLGRYIDILGCKKIKVVYSVIDDEIIVEEIDGKQIQKID